MSTKPNILMIVSDEERRNDWMGDLVDMPAHDRLRADGLSFDRHYTHSSPCSPSRASLFTGQYLAQHGVVDNVSFPNHKALDPSIPTIGSILGQQGYRSSYLGKWHLSHSHEPDLTAHGYHDFQGDDAHFTGSAWSGMYFDPIIAGQAIDWLGEHGSSDEPWFLTVSLVNPHDIMWFPIDHLSHQEAHPEDREIFEFIRKIRLDGVPIVAPPEDYPERFNELPNNFYDDLMTKPEIQRTWQRVRNSEHFVGSMDLTDTRSWMRQLDYYAWLHEQLDKNLARLLAELDRLGLYDETAIFYTSDHGDACGSHGLRAKLPCVYEEVMGVPMIAKVPGRTEGGGVTQALSSHVDLAATICALGGAEPAENPSLSGADLGPVLDDPTTSVRDHIFFSQDSAQSEALRDVRYAVRGFFDGKVKYARYYGVGGGVQRDGSAAPTPKQFDVDADFEDCEHELYDLDNDPAELENRAHGSGQPAAREHFERLLEIERTELSGAD